ncbi:MAG: hypothetical protein A2Y73_09175 [Chloroflexi bacterium RBG_13_56_8]|nr:MAG: hypothetical protein A2Y73_09175 [Chloroflexi bacterium RBG_13_56_8]
MVDLTLSSQCEYAAKLVQDSQPRRAIGVCRHILATFPRHIMTYTVLGQAFLELGQYANATELFRRVLSADPEDAFSYVCLAAIREGERLLDETIWYLERAFELSPGNSVVRSELRRLYDQRNISPGERVKLTRGALARTYLRGQLYPKAIGELRELTILDPQRLDLRVALAEALWHDGRMEDAARECQNLLVELPNCLKANLILGRIWLDTEKDEEARALLQRAQSLDPAGAVAQRVLGARSPLPPREPRLPPMEDQVPAVNLPYVSDEEEYEEEASVGRWGEILLDEISPADYDGPREEDRVGGLSLIDVRRQYLKEHSNDYAARLDLARRLRDIGNLGEALREYDYLIEHHYEALTEVMHDLNLWARLYPDMVKVKDLRVKAQERERRKPSS